MSESRGNESQHFAARIREACPFVSRCGTLREYADETKPTSAIDAGTDCQSTDQKCLEEADPVPDKSRQPREPVAVFMVKRVESTKESEPLTSNPGKLRYAIPTAES